MDMWDDASGGGMVTHSCSLLSRKIEFRVSNTLSRCTRVSPALPPPPPLLVIICVKTTELILFGRVLST